MNDRKTPEANETIEGMVWPIVVLVELPVPQVEALSRELERISIIVLVEGSMLRASQMVKEQRPHVVVAPSSLPIERTQVLRDAAREIGIEVMLVSATAAPEIVFDDVRAAVTRVTKSRPAPRSSR